MMKIINLKAKVGDKQILNGINLEIKPGEVVAVMGPNGSGKSTLAYSLSGHPKYEVSGKINLDGKEISKMSPDERANEGLFLANQYPVAIPGLTVNSFLWQVYKKRIKYQVSSIKYKEIQKNIVEFREWVEKQAKTLDLNPELLKRGLNDGFSGGEKKKLEILQLLVFNPKYVILDEIDSGLDVDALSKIAKTMAKVAKELKIGVLVITHYNRILKYLKADRVVIMEKGLIVKEGGAKLAEQIEVSGYKND
jgi:Fe-S cluster assembly ATP-binding protein